MTEEEIKEAIRKEKWQDFDGVSATKLAAFLAKHLPRECEDCKHGAHGLHGHLPGEERFCCCGERERLGVVHRTDGPCYVPTP